MRQVADITIRRIYKPDPERCAQALVRLLEKSAGCCTGQGTTANALDGATHDSTALLDCTPWAREVLEAGGINDD